MRLLPALLLLIPILVPARAALGPAPEDYAARFDRMDERVNNGRGFSEALNGSGTLAWSEGFILQSYAEMYRATGDTAYLDRLIEHFDRILANRDDARHVKDFFRGTSLAGWGSDEYSKGKWHVWAVHTGMICLGPIDFVGLVKAEGHLRKRYASKANEYLDRIEQSVAAHDPDWKDGPGPNEGYYHDPAIGPLPLNQQNALGLVELGLYLVTRDHVYKDRVERLANYFRNRLRRQPDGAYDWAYCPPPRTHGQGSEDISHAAINVEFAVRCRFAHIVFSDKDLDAFARTWTEHIRRGDGDWADTVGGTGGPNTYIPQALGRWLDVAAYGQRIYDDARQAFADMDENQASGANLLGLAKLARRQRELREKRKHLRLPHIKL